MVSSQNKQPLKARSKRRLKREKESQAAFKKHSLKARLKHLLKREKEVKKALSTSRQFTLKNVFRWILFAFLTPSALRREALEIRRLRQQLSRIETEIEELREEHGEELFESHLSEELQNRLDAFFTSSRPSK